ncbi:hypothetical protein [Muricoccus vinaceus]|uniref:Uncharacterized protein n=1 Tax=Muricoccus vinaceus TaxID=424704 RepID=A0ABV6IVQ3_9PROT
MNITSHGYRHTRLVLGLTLALGAAACAQQATPMASAPQAADMSIQPAGRSTAMPASSPQGMQGSSMQGMDHSNMPGMRGGSMQGMDHSNMPGMRGGSNAQGGGMQGQNMSGMTMPQMMAHCAEMRQQMRVGASMSSDMQAMMAHCDQMGGSTGTQRGARAR